MLSVCMRVQHFAQYMEGHIVGIAARFQSATMIATGNSFRAPR